MLLKNLSFGAFFGLVLAVSVQGATVSFMVIETGLREGTPTIESSRIWEDALLDVFFDTGHIVSNSPIIRVSDKPQNELPDAARVSLNDALEGGADFFVVAVLDYRNPELSDPELLKPRNISLRLFRTAPYQFIFSQEYTGEERITMKDEMTNAMSAARIIVSHLKDK